MVKKIREQTLTISSYLREVNGEDISENQDVQRMFCWDNASINELIVTVLTDDYIPPIIIGEVEIGDGITQQYIVDGIQRTTALNKFRYMNWRTTKTFENSVIKYQKKLRDADNHLLKDDEGNILWENCEFDIKGKTFDQLPEELQHRFDDYHINMVIHQNCTMMEISKLVRRYNRNKAMSANQKSLTWLPTFARKTKNIARNKFYTECVAYSDTLRKNGTYEQSVADCVTAVFHFDNWSNRPADRNDKLEDCATAEEFKTINEYGERIAEVCGDKFQDIFVFKDVPLWFKVFDNFVKNGLSDAKFAEFIQELSSNLHSHEINGDSYDSLNAAGGTNNKKLFTKKFDLYMTLLNEFLHIKMENIFTEEIAVENTEKKDEVVKTETEQTEMSNERKFPYSGGTFFTWENRQKAENEQLVKYVKENVDKTVEEEDVQLYKDIVEDCVKITSPLYIACKFALIALAAYACKIDKDTKLPDWVEKCEKNKLTFDSYSNMKNNFDEFVQHAA